MLHRWSPPEFARRIARWRSLPGRMPCAVLLLAGLWLASNLVAAIADDAGRSDRTVAQTTPSETDPAGRSVPPRKAVQNAVRPGVRAPQRLPGVTPEREAAVMKFVERHHPELAALLAPLKESRPPEYERAVRDLFRVSERLAQFHERDAARYDVELRLWQAQSRIDVLSAQLKMGGSDELKLTLRETLDEQLSLRQTLLRLERQRLLERLEKLDEQLETLTATRDEAIERQLRQLLEPASRPVKTPGAIKAIGTAKAAGASRKNAGQPPPPAETPQL